jgi:hypothetical protein
VSEPREPAEASSDRPLTPGEALQKLFMDNADQGANAANDNLIEELQQRIRGAPRRHPLARIRPRPGRWLSGAAPVMRSPGLPAAGRSHSGWLDMCTVLVRRVNG